MEEDIPISNYRTGPILQILNITTLSISVKSKEVADHMQKCMFVQYCVLQAFCVGFTKQV